MLNHIQNIISQSVKSSYFAKAYNDVRLSNGKLISYNADGTNGEFTGIQDVKENYFYIRVITDATATDERVSSCGNNVMQANLRLVCVFWNDNVYSASNFVTSRLKASINRLKINSVIVDYDTIWNNEMPGVEIKRYNGLNVISVDFNVKFSYKQIIADSPCKVDECEPTKICKDGFVILKDEQGNIILEQIVPSGAIINKVIDLSCADATADLFDTNGNLLSTTQIASGATQPIIAPDATILINGDNSFPTIPSGGLENIVVENTAGTPVGAYDGNSNSWVTPDITVTDSDGSTFTQPSVTDVVCTPVTPLTVDFSVDDTSPDTNQTITFTDLTVGATQWLWDFGDGNLSTLQNPTHSYKTTGSFTVTLCASDGTNAGREVKTNYITVTLEAELTTNLLASFNAGNYNDISGSAQAWFENISGEDVIQNTLANRPLIIPNGLNGFDTLQGNGVNLQLANLGAGIAYTDGTVYIVFKRGRIHTANEAMTSSGSNQFAKIIYNISNEVSYFPRNTTLSRGVSYGNNVGQWLIMAVVFNGASSTIKFMQSAPAPIGNIGSTASTGLVLFASQGGGNFQGELAEVKIYNAVHNAATQTQVIQRLQAKFNLYG